MTATPQSVTVHLTPAAYGAVQAAAEHHASLDVRGALLAAFERQQFHRGCDAPAAPFTLSVPADVVAAVVEHMLDDIAALERVAPLTEGWTRDKVYFRAAARKTAVQALRHALGDAPAPLAVVA